VTAHGSLVEHVTCHSHTGLQLSVAHVTKCFVFLSLLPHRCLVSNSFQQEVAFKVRLDALVLVTSKTSQTFVLLPSRCS